MPADLRTGQPSQYNYEIQAFQTLATGHTVMSADFHTRGGRILSDALQLDVTID